MTYGILAKNKSEKLLLPRKIITQMVTDATLVTNVGYVLTISYIFLSIKHNLYQKMNKNYF